jgi:hypothetical protein
MRTSLGLAALLLLGLVGTAAASDYMLPVLLPPNGYGPAAPGAPGAASPHEPQQALVAAPPNAGMAEAVAALAAAAVVGGGFVLLRRRAA